MIIFDMDGTLSLPGDRLKYLQQDPKDWDAFYEACDQDAPNAHIVCLCRQLSGETIIKIVTGRRESVRQKTFDWLERHSIYIRNTDLYMRKDGDFRPDTVVKPELIVDIKDVNDEIQCIFEDRTSMVDAWRNLGFTCLQVSEGDF